jgi:hypothetical protein
MAQGLSKFPVTTADGTEYRVSITEEGATDWHDDCAYIRLYKERERKLFGFIRFKLVDRERMYEKDGYDVKNPDYIAIATWGIRGYEEHLRWRAEYDVEKVVKQTEYERKQSEAVRRFNEWDGKICD